MKASEVHSLTEEEISVEIDRLQRKLFDLRCAVVTEKIEDPSQFGKIRKDIARLKTERKTRELNGKASK
ncbi:MAG: 50S ribosomal protein L29 [Planctomycetota bacterium]